MEALFLKLVNMSITASYLVLAVLLFRVLLKKAPKYIRVILWGLVGLRLVFPFSIESVLSLIPNEEPLPEEFLYAATPQINTGISYVNNALNPVIAQSLTPIELTSANPTQIWSFIFSHIWMIGMVVMVLYAVISYGIVRRKVRVSIPVGKNLRLCDYIDTPFILGIIRPKIYLPSNLDQATADHVMAHECAHLKRKDHWWKPLGFALLSIYWFNPVMWLAYILLCRDIELACDEKVVRELDTGEKKAYSEALLTCSVPRHLIAACPLAFGEVGVKARIKSVLNYKKPAFWIVVVAVTVSAVVAVCFLTDPKSATVSDILNQNGYEILNQSDISFTINIPKSILPDSIYSEDGHDFEPGEVIVSRIGDTSVQLTNARYSNETPNLMYFSFQFVNTVSESGTIITHHKMLEGNTSTNNMNVEAKTLSDESRTYENAVSLRGLDPLQCFTVYIDTAACQAAEGFLNFHMYANAITYSKEGYEVADAKLLLSADTTTYTVDEQLAQNIALSAIIGYSDKVITLENNTLTILSETDDSLEEFRNPKVTFYGTEGRDEILDQTRYAFVAVEDGNYKAITEDFWNEYTGKNMVVLEYYEKDSDESPACAIVCFDGEPTWFVEGNFMRIYILHPATSRLAVGTYIPVECVYMNPLSSYSANNLSSEYVYTVTEDGFFTESSAFICNTSVTDVNWGWKAMTDAVENLEFYIQWQQSDWGKGHGPELHKNTLYQMLDERTHLLLAGDALYIIHGGPSDKDTELVWGIYKLERRDDSEIAGGEISGIQNGYKLTIENRGHYSNGVSLIAEVQFPKSIPVSELNIMPKEVRLCFTSRYGETQHEASHVETDSIDEETNTIRYLIYFVLYTSEPVGTDFTLLIEDFKNTNGTSYDFGLSSGLSVSWQADVAPAKLYSALEEDVRASLTISPILIQAEVYDFDLESALDLINEITILDRLGNEIDISGRGAGTKSGTHDFISIYLDHPVDVDDIGTVMIGDSFLAELMID